MVAPIAPKPPISIAQVAGSGTAPDGTTWAPLKRRAGRPLRDTGRLMNGLTRAARITDRGFALGTNVSYAPYHQSGTTRTPARPFLPAPGELPRSWEGPLREAAEEASAYALKKLA